jgi:F-type H+-transporting ATPase subunit gamma
MSVELREVKRRIGGVRQVRRVTSTLQRVAAARVNQHRRAIEQANRYIELSRLLLGRVAAELQDPSDALFRPRAGGATCLLVFAADRGLCGGFVSGLMEHVADFADRSGARDLRLLVMGRIAARRARRLGLRVDDVFKQAPIARPGDESDPDEVPPAVGTMADRALDGFRDGTFCQVFLAYSRFISVLRQQPTVERLLPPDIPAPAESRARSVLTEPGPSEILRRLVPEHVAAAVYAAFLNSLGSENAARQMAMSRATDNAGEILDGLVTSYRRLRQESITTEMIELFGGLGPADVPAEKRRAG